MAVITPISLDHVDYLGPDVETIAGEKAGIIKPGATAVLAQQELPAARQVLMRQAAEVGATVAREGLEFGVISRELAIGGQLLRLKGLKGTYDEILLPLYGAHQAGNAACALAAVEALTGGDEPLDAELVRQAFLQSALAGQAGGRATGTHGGRGRRAQPGGDAGQSWTPVQESFDFAQAHRR